MKKKNLEIKISSNKPVAAYILLWLQYLNNYWPVADRIASSMEGYPLYNSSIKE